MDGPYLIRPERTAALPFFPVTVQGTTVTTYLPEGGALRIREHLPMEATMTPVRGWV